MLFHKFENKYIVKGILEAKSPIHIGGGEDSINPLQVANSVIKDLEGRPYIPGSSLKGVLRSYLENILYDEKHTKSCLIIDEPCTGNDDDLIKKLKEYIKDKQLANKDDEEKLISEKIYESMCSVCKIFGSKNFASKIKISDCTLRGDKVYVEHRDGIGICRDTGVNISKYDYEQVAAGSCFEFYMVFDNIEKDLEDNMKLIINILTSGELYVGGKTSVGLGKVQLNDYVIYKIDKNNLRKYLDKGVCDEMRWEYA